VPGANGTNLAEGRGGDPIEVKQAKNNGTNAGWSRTRGKIAVMQMAILLPQPGPSCNPPPASATAADRQSEPHEGSMNVSEAASADANLDSEVERFLEESGFRHQLVLEGFPWHFKETLERHGLRMAALQQRGSCLKIHIDFPPAHTPSKKFKLNQMMHALVRESGYTARRLWLTVKEWQVSMWIVPQDE
jgi:hypothetical protein